MSMECKGNMGQFVGSALWQHQNLSVQMNCQICSPMSEFLCRLPFHLLDSGYSQLSPLSASTASAVSWGSDPEALASKVRAKSKQAKAEQYTTLSLLLQALYQAGQLESIKAE